MRELKERVLQALKGIDENSAIHCRTEEENKAVCEVLDMKGYRTVMNRSFSDFNGWDVRGPLTAYAPALLVFHSVKYFEAEDFHIITGEEFVKLNS